MQLAAWIKFSDLTPAKFAGLIGEVTLRSVYRYVNGSRFPRRSVMQRIVEITHGQVGPNDFFDPPNSSTPLLGTPTAEPAQVGL